MDYDNEWWWWWFARIVRPPLEWNGMAADWAPNIEDGGGGGGSAALSNLIIMLRAEQHNPFGAPF